MAASWIRILCKCPLHANLLACAVDEGGLLARFACSFGALFFIWSLQPESSCYMTVPHASSAQALAIPALRRIVSCIRHEFCRRRSLCNSLALQGASKLGEHNNPNLQYTAIAMPDAATQTETVLIGSRTAEDERHAEEVVFRRAACPALYQTSNLCCNITSL